MVLFRKKYREYTTHTNYCCVESKFFKLSLLDVISSDIGRTMVVETDQYDYQVYDKLFDVKDITIDGQKRPRSSAGSRKGDQN